MSATFHVTTNSSKRNDSRTEMKSTVHTITFPGSKEHLENGVRKQYVGTFVRAIATDFREMETKRELLIVQLAHFVNCDLLQVNIVFGSF